jgi:hypothetical protein
VGTEVGVADTVNSIRCNWRRACTAVCTWGTCRHFDSSPLRSVLDPVESESDVRPSAGRGAPLPPLRAGAGHRALPSRQRPPGPSNALVPYRAGTQPGPRTRTAVPRLRASGMNRRRPAVPACRAATTAATGHDQLGQARCRRSRRCRRTWSSTPSSTRSASRAKRSRGPFTGCGTTCARGLGVPGHPHTSDVGCPPRRPRTSPSSFRAHPRPFYFTIDPLARQYWLLSVPDDPHAVMRQTGQGHSRWHLLSHAGTSVAVVTAVIRACSLDCWPR